MGLLVLMFFGALVCGHFDLAAQEESEVEGGDAGEAASTGLFGDEEDGMDIPLEELMSMSGTVISASRYEQSITEAPSSVTVIRHEDIQRFGYRTLADMLKSVRGFYVSSDRNYNSLGVRGFNRGDYNSRVLVLVNGHRMNNNISGGARIGTPFLLDVDLIDRVEIVRGPGSVLYGNNAFFGVINVVTRSGSDIGRPLSEFNQGVEVGGSYGEFDTLRGRFTYGNPEVITLAGSPIDLMLSGSLFDSQGDDSLYFPEFDQPVTNRGVVSDGDSTDFGSFYGALTWRDFRLHGGWVDRLKQDPTAAIGSAFNDPRTNLADERSYVHLDYEHEFGETIVAGQLYYDRFDSTAFVPFDRPNPDVVQNQQGRWWGAEMSARRSFGERYQAVLGAEYRDDFDQELSIIELGGAGVGTQLDRQIYSVFF